MHDQDKIQSLLMKYLDDTLTSGEREQLFEWVRRDPDNARWSAALQQIGMMQQKDPLYNEARWQEVVEQITGTQTKDSGVYGTATNRGHFLKAVWFRYAAAVLLLVGAGGYMWYNSDLFRSRHAVHSPASVQTAAAEILPGGNRAVLTLADGSTITLDDAPDGNLTTQGNATIIKLEGSRLAYNANGKTEKLSYNILSTPRGGLFQVTLSDGTKVWLNSASSLRYPIAFDPHERNVEITGEAYFEIAPLRQGSGARVPFKVKLNGKNEIDVLATNFNVNAYADEEIIRTTLLQGSVRISAGKDAQTITPGQQAQMPAGTPLSNKSQGSVFTIKVVDNVDVNRVMAWKNGVFDFQDAQLKEVMRELSRWYDIDVVYEKNIPNTEFWGKMGKNLTLSQVLKGLEGSGVNFRIEGKKLIVLP